ncbi:hypothetical protein F4777DRAFT_309328 [Nemania sp. FL0916]|nr:hypothetical protein F4777DRAFT_309328 [Nemania sp. FL0916]
MVKPIPSASIQLTYPLYCCDFVDPNHLVVAGGGGPGRHGVGNKMTVLDTSDATQLTEAAELELSAHEDNVMSLVVVGQQKDKNTNAPKAAHATTVLAGVNSSPADVGRGQNKHLRALTIAQPGSSAKSGTGGVKISEVARDALFVHRDRDTYQRLLRVSPSHHGLASSPRLGAAATGLSKHPQIALFDVPATNSSPWWKSRGRLDPRVEAMDLDVIQTGPDTYQLAYCDDHDVFTVEVSKAEVSEPRCVYSIEPDEGETNKASFKSLRYLTTGFLVTVVNNPKSRGVALHGLRLPKNDDENARLAIRAKLPSSVSKATSLAVRNLSPVALPSDKQGEAQFVIAVAGNDSSISLYTVEHKSAFDSDILSDLAPFQVLKSVHSSSITNLSISAFAPPKDATKTSDLCVKLASVSVGCSTVVHNIPIKKHVDKSASAKPGQPSKLSRYVVALKSKGESPATAITLVSLVFLILVLVGQVLIEAKDIGEPILGVRKYLPASWTVPLRQVPKIQVSENKPKTIENLLADVNAHHSQQMVIKHDDFGAIGPDGLPALHVDVHNEELHGPATSWDKLEKNDQDLWKQRLKKSGHWVEDMGESIFKGVLFGEIGGAIGNIVGEAL